jgi:voltage-gated potassium channel
MSDDVSLGALPEHISRGERIGVFMWAVVRVLIGLLGVVVVMSLAPDAPTKTPLYSIVMVTFLIVGYGAYFWYQLRGVSKARFPTLRALEALILMAAMFLAVFSIAYLLISRGNSEAFTEPLNGFTAYYFSLTVLATVGFGDITPKTVGARSVTMVQMALDLVFVAVLLRVVTGAARRAVSSRLRGKESNAKVTQDHTTVDS